MAPPVGEGSSGWSSPALLHFTTSWKRYDKHKGLRNDEHLSFIVGYCTADKQEINMRPCCCWYWWRSCSRSQNVYALAFATCCHSSSLQQ